MYRYTLIITIFFINISIVKAELKSSQNCRPRVPVVDYKEAISIALKERDQFFKPDEAFIDLIKLNCEKNKYKWQIGFRRKSYETGHLIISIFMNKKTSISVVKDG